MRDKSRREAPAGRDLRARGSPSVQSICVISFPRTFNHWGHPLNGSMPTSTPFHPAREFQSGVGGGGGDTWPSLCRRSRQQATRSIAWHKDDPCRFAARAQRLASEEHAFVKWKFVGERHSKLRSSPTCNWHGRFSTAHRTLSACPNPPLLTYTACKTPGGRTWQSTRPPSAFPQVGLVATVEEA